MTNIKQKLAQDNGDITINNERYILTQMPYIDGTNEDAYYTARAIKDSDQPDEDNFIPVYQLIWDIINTETEDESEACEWDSPSDIKDQGERYDLTNRWII